ncbi:MAG: hypothetical protein Q6K08_03460, partial [Thermostichales cyanobacterium GMQP_bins_62]
MADLEPVRSGGMRQERGQSLRVLIFPLSGKQLGLPLEMVRKVLRYPGVISINSQGLGLVELPNVPRPLLALDLTHFLDQRQGSFSWSQAFLLLIEPSAENIMAVPIPTLPTLVDVPL